MDLHALQAFSPWSQHLLPSAAATLGREPLPVQTDHQGSLWEEKETQHRQLGARDKAGLSQALSQPPQRRYPKPIIPAWPAELQACPWTTTRQLTFLPKEALDYD